MTLAERLSEYVRAASAASGSSRFEHDDAIAEIARLCRQQGWTLATWDIDRGLSLAGGRRRPDDVRRRRRPAGRDPGARRPGHARRHGAAGAAELPPVPGQRRGRPGPRHGRSPPASRTGPSSWSSRPVVQIPVELEKQFVVDRARPARPRPARGDRPRDRHRAGRAARGRRPGRRARRGGRPDPGRGRERLQPVAGPPRPGRPGRALGAQGPGAQEVGLLTLHRGGETFADLGGLDALKAFCRRALRPRAVQLAGAAPRRPAARRPGHGQERVLQGPGQRDGPADAVLDVGALMGSLVGQTEERTSARPCGSPTRWPRASSSSTRSRRASPASRPAARPTAASRPGCSARC